MLFCRQSREKGNYATVQKGFISSLVMRLLVAPSHEKLIFDPGRELTMTRSKG